MESNHLEHNIVRNELKFAFIQTIPILMGYLFLGMAFGLLLQKAGYNFIWAFFISLFVYAGSMQFILVTLLSGGVGLLYTAIMTIFINGRHIFYGLSFIEKYRNSGKFYPYLVFSLTDETYSVLCSCKIPDEMNKNRVMFLISLLDQLYWILGSVIGALLGQIISFSTAGIEFSMTALFIVIFIEQWKENSIHSNSITGFLAAIICLLIFGPDRFIIPALVLCVAILLLFRVRGKSLMKNKEIIENDKTVKSNSTSLESEDAMNEFN